MRYCRAPPAHRCPRRQRQRQRQRVTGGPLWPHAMGPDIATRQLVLPLQPPKACLQVCRIWNVRPTSDSQPEPQLGRALGRARAPGTGQPPSGRAGYQRNYGRPTCVPIAHVRHSLCHTEHSEFRQVFSDYRRNPPDRRLTVARAIPR